MFIIEKQLNLCKDSKFGGHFNGLYSLPLLYSRVAVKTKSYIIMQAVKTSILAATGRGRTDLELPKIPIPRELSLFDLFGSSISETSTQSLTLFYLTWGLLTENSLHLRGICGGKNSSNCLTLHLL